MFANISVVLPHIRSGTLKALAIAANRRFPHLPDVPTFNEVGMPEMEMSVWGGIFLPAGTPAQIALALNQATRAAAATNVIQPLYEAMGATVEVDATPEAFMRFLQADTRKWVPLVKSMGITAQ